MYIYIYQNTNIKLLNIDYFYHLNYIHNILIDTNSNYYNVIISDIFFNNEYINR